MHKLSTTSSKHFLQASSCDKKNVNKILIFHAKWPEEALNSQSSAQIQKPLNV
jgi:hypothetical protein